MNSEPDHSDEQPGSSSGVCCEGHQVNSGARFCGQCGLRTAGTLETRSVGHEWVNGSCAKCGSTEPTIAPSKGELVTSRGAVQAPAEPRPEWTICDGCGRYPALVVDFRVANFAIVYMRLKKSSAVALCRDCGLSLFREVQVKNGTSMLTNPLFGAYALLRNGRWQQRLHTLPAPYFKA